MLCDKCGSREAEVHLVKIVNGERQVERLCRQCARKVLPIDDAARKMRMSFSMEGFSGFDGSLLDLLAPVLSELCGGETDMFHCPNCGAPIPRDFIEGSDPDTPDAALKALCHIDCDEETDLCRELEKAVKDERYERAAELRDRLKQFSEKKGE